MSANLPTPLPLLDPVVRQCVKRPWLVLAVTAVLTALMLFVTVTRFAINTSTSNLISPEIDWRKNDIAMNAAFPQTNDLIVVVIDGPTPEAASDAADRLVAAVRAQGTLFTSVQRPDSTPFLQKNGLLLLPQDQLAQTLTQLERSQLFLAPLAADPSLRGLMGALQTGFEAAAGPGAAAGLGGMAPTLDLLAAALDRVRDGKRADLSWQALLSGAPPSASDLRKIVTVQAVLNFNALQPGAAATDRIREIATKLGLTADNGIRLRLTGEVALADEEFATVAENATLNTSLTILAIAAILFVALRSGRLIVAVLITLFVGLVITSGLGLLMVGQLNLISVAFAVLFIGLGVDFGIQVAVRYRGERFAGRAVDAATRGAANEVGWSLTLAAASLLAGFLSFLPTPYSGVSELGLIAGVGMIVAYVASLTVLPALIVLLRPRAETVPVETLALAGVDRWIERHRRLVIGATIVLVLAGLPILAQVRFDANPMHLRSPAVESVSTFLDLSRSPETSPNTIEILAPDLTRADALAARLAVLPEVARATTLSTFLPAGQDEKLAAIAEARAALAAVLTPPGTAPSPDDAELVAALSQTATMLSQAASAMGTEAPRALTRLADSLDRLANADPARRQAADQAIRTGAQGVLGQIRTSLGAERITRQTLPRSLVADWIASGDRARIQVAARENVNDSAALDRFSTAVRALAPDATGAPIVIAESGRTIVHAFLEAGIFALVAIFLILVVALRRPRDVFLALAPLVVAGLVSLEAAHLIGLSLNFANIIALPLMFGVGVAFHIYYVIAWRAGISDMLASSLTRAIFFSALTTGTAFGSLCFSSHPGTASMGELLAISLVFTLLAAFIIVPAFLGPPPQVKG